MNTYVFGKHSGAVEPGSLVGGEPGSRIRAAVRLDGADDVLYAIEAEDEDGLQNHLLTITTAGTTVITFPLTVCVDTECLALLKDISYLPMWLPPFDIYVFAALEGDGPLDVLVELEAPGVAAATDGHGRFVVELGGAERAPLERDMERLQAAANVRALNAGWASAKTLVRL
ncbi:MAG TPA: hypothetical protein VNE21_06870 [Mycobacteriales bacterium]|nr:hypothetical protein [Mycobacteriales bacterium]